MESERRGMDRKDGEGKKRGKKWQEYESRLRLCAVDATDPFPLTPAKWCGLFEFYARRHASAAKV